MEHGDLIYIPQDVDLWNFQDNGGLSHFKTKKPTIPVNNATVQTPIKAVNAPTNFPNGVIGETSPYPTVVRVINDHHIA